MNRLFTGILGAIVLALGSVSAEAACTYTGGYPWQAQSCLTAADINAAFATAYAPATALAPGVAATNLGNAGGEVSGPWSNLQVARPLPNAAIPAATLTGLGGVFRSVSVPNQFVTGIGVLGGLTRAQPVIADIGGMGAGAGTFLTTPTSANLRALMTDETGVGLLYFQGGNLGTPSAGVGTNLTGIPLSTGVTGTLPAASMPALTGDVTNPAGSLTTTVTTLRAGAVLTPTTGTLATLAGTETLSSKTLATPTITGTANVSGGNVSIFGSAAPSVLFNGTSGSDYALGSNTALPGIGIFDSTAAAWRFVLRDTTGDIGMGTTSPQARLDLRSASGGIQLVAGDAITDATAKFSRIGSAHYTNAEEPVSLLLGNSASTTSSLSLGGGSGVMNAVTSLNFYTAANNTTPTGTLAATIDSAQRLILGASSGFNGTGAFQRQFQLYGSTGQQIGRFSADAFSPGLTFTKSRNTTVGSHTAVQSGDNVGQIIVAGSDGTNYITAVQILGVADGAVSSGVVPGRLSFWTADSSGTNTERVRIDSSGRVGIGIGSGAPAYPLQVSEASAVASIYDTATVGVGVGGEVYLSGKNNASTQTPYASIKGHATNASPGAETGSLLLKNRQAGALTTVADFTGTNLSLSARTISRSVTNDGLLLYGGTLADGANIELYGGTAGAASAMFLDAASITFRDQPGTTSRAALSSTGLTVVSTVHAYNGTAIPAGGTTGTCIKVSSTANFGICFGSGVPTLSAAQGSVYLRSDGSSTSTRAYINTDGGTTWTAITTGAFLMLPTPANDNRIAYLPEVA